MRKMEFKIMKGHDEECKKKNKDLVRCSMIISNFQINSQNLCSSEMKGDGAQSAGRKKQPMEKKK